MSLSPVSLPPSSAHRFIESSLGTINQSTAQEIGKINTRAGLAMCFPNILQHKVSSFHLLDPSLPGYRKFLLFWLCDPTLEIPSTANVTPQQLEWLNPSVYDVESYRDPSSPSSNIYHLLHASLPLLPPPLLYMVLEYCYDEFGLMTMEDAKVCRAALMEERKLSTKHVTSSYEQSYSLCEH